MVVWFRTRFPLFFSLWMSYREMQWEKLVRKNCCQRTSVNSQITVSPRALYEETLSLHTENCPDVWLGSTRRWVQENMPVVRKFYRGNLKKKKLKESSYYRLVQLRTECDNIASALACEKGRPEVRLRSQATSASMFLFYNFIWGTPRETSHVGKYVTWC